MRRRNHSSVPYVMQDILGRNNWMITLYHFTKGLENLLANCVIRSTYAKKTTLNFHISKVHEGKKPNKFTVCDACFQTKNARDRHIKSVHEGKKPHEGFDEHKEKTHETQNSYTCSMCNSRFKNQLRLDIHISSTHKPIVLIYDVQIINQK